MFERAKNLLKSKERAFLLEQKIARNHAIAIKIAEILVEQGEATVDSSGYSSKSQLSDKRVVLVEVDNGVLGINIFPTDSETKGFLISYDLGTQELIDFQERYQDNGLKLWYVFGKGFMSLNPKFKLGALDIYAEILQETKEALIGLVI